MKFGHIFSVIALLGLAYPLLATAYDPSPLQDVCVATNDTNSAVQVNGKFCKNPDTITSDDFYFSGLNIPRNTANSLGVNVTLLTVDSIPGLNTQSISLARIDYAPNGGLNPPHTHPRAAEILWCLEGTLYAGFVTTNPDHRLYTKVLKPGDVFVFPFGLIHFQLNVGNSSALAVAALTSQNPGVMTIANALFGSNPDIDPRVLSKAFHLSESLVEELQGETWQNP